MKFTGQVRVPEVDHPGVPATIVVEEGQTEVFLEGESLGRWSLFDVHASRLVSSAFSISLGGEEITFIADEPVDFAYKGVDHMAEAWARYKSMTIPRRVVAVGRSRRGTVPSRIAELREAMLQNLESSGRPAPRLARIENPPTPFETHRRTPEPVDEQVEPGPVVEELAPVDHAPPVVEEVAPPTVEEVAPPTVEEEASATRAPLRPGAGLYARRVAQPEVPVEEPESVFAPPAEEKAEEGPVSGFPLDVPVFAEETASVVEEAEPVAAEALTPVFVEEVEPVFVEEPVPDDEPRPVEEPEEPAASREVPELVKEFLGTSEEEEAERPRELVVDLGHYEGGSSGDAQPPDEPEPILPGREPVLAGAPAAAPERGGLLGAVRSAFARNRVPHEHQFVEAPGGIGIVRQICAECGYISIGVTD